MGPYDSCRLMHLNLTSFVNNPYTSKASINFDLLYEVSYKAMRLSDDLVDLEIESIDKIIAKIIDGGDQKELKLWEQIKTSAISGRRTGLGFTGLADVFAMMGYKYGDTESLTLLKFIMHNMMLGQLDSTIDMAVIRGAFDGYDYQKEYPIDADGQDFTHGNKFYEKLWYDFPEQTERMRQYGRRNVSWSTVAPTGTVSLMTQTSSGIEPVFLPYYQRRRKCSSPNDRVDYVDNVGEKYTEFFVLHPKFKEWIQLNSVTLLALDGEVDFESLDKNLLQLLFEKSPWYNSTSSEINWKDRIKVQAVVQNYITHAISSTLNLNSNITEKEVSDIYLEAWKRGLKGITIYRDGSRSGILNSVKEKSTEPERQAKKRPKVLEADYYQVKSKGQQYIVLIGLLNNKPYEVFTFKPLNNVDIKPHKGTITKIKKGQYSYDSNFIRIDNLELSTDNIEEKACSLYTSMLLRHNADIKFIIKTAKKVNENITSFSSAMCRVLSKYVELEELKGEVCPECGGKLIREAGCVKCLDCDYSKCL